MFKEYYAFQVFLGQCPEAYFDDELMKAAYDAFKVDLERIEKKIRDRNAKLDIPYTYLLPSAVPNSASM